MDEKSNLENITAAVSRIIWQPCVITITWRINLAILGH